MDDKLRRGTPVEGPHRYTISADHWSREDYSQEANPSVFTGVYSRELYNTIRQTMAEGTSGDPAYPEPADRIATCRFCVL